MSGLEQQGVSTSAIRNRKRRRKAANRTGPKKMSQSADTPSFFSCCAVGLAFGDATEDDDEAYRQFQKQQYEERQQQQSAHEDALRKQYMKRNGPSNKLIKNPILEAVEIVD
jgi:hypothetical protein